MRRRKNQLIDMSDISLQRVDKEDLVGKEVYKKSYQKIYKKKYLKKTSAIKIELRKEEYLRLKKIANDTKLPLSKLILEGYYATEKKVKLRSKVYSDILVELSRIGNNMNQIAAQLNMKRNIFFSNHKSSFDQMRDKMIEFLNLMQKQPF